MVGDFLWKEKMAVWKEKVTISAVVCSLFGFLSISLVPPVSSGFLAVFFCFNDSRMYEYKLNDDC